MKTLSLLAALLGFSGLLLAQTLEPGVYQSKNGQHPALITTAENSITYKDYRDNVTYTLSGEQKYTKSGSGVYLQVIDTGRFTLAEETSTWKQEFTLYAPANASPAAGVIKFDWNGGKYYAAPGRISEVIGRYGYGKDFGAPIIELVADGSGIFQPHGRPGIPIQWMVESDYKGNLQKFQGENGNYRMFLVVKYGAGGDRNYAEGTYDRLQMDVFPTKQETRILGERVRKW